MTLRCRCCLAIAEECVRSRVKQRHAQCCTQCRCAELLLEEVRRAVGAQRARYGRRPVQVLCAECREPLYGRLCWNPGCLRSIHAEQGFLLNEARTVVETVGEAV